MQRRISKLARRGRTVSVPVNLGGGKSTKDPAISLQQALADELDSTKQPSKGRCLKDMSPEERAAIEAQYGAKIKEEAPDAFVAVKVDVCGTTDKAVHVHQTARDGWTTRAWIPRSAIENGEKVVEGVTVLMIEAWKVREARLRRRENDEE